ncbi:MAG: hypothetical protein JO166_07245 [Deltaproteobacteria bacterium]|nr:hypothetical protein [Deltaproteobacteria bacterium]
MGLNPTDRTGWLLGLLTSVSVIVSAIAAETSQPDWTLDSVNHCRVWNQNPRGNEGVIWSGECRDGYAQGRGTVQWYHDQRPTDRYVGELRGGKANGYGVLTMGNGDRYEGHWVDGKAEGLGHVLLSSGYDYMGIWSDGCARDGDKFVAVGRDPSSCY